MATNRRKVRTEAFNLLFETEFKQDEPREEIFAVAQENREFDADPYIHDVYFGVYEHLEEIDALIGRHANGWKVSRLSRVSRSILRLCVYELLYCPDIPESVSINEAVELCKTYEEEKARSFVNGVLNGIKNEILGARDGKE